MSTITRQDGFTLIEVLITLAVIGIVATIAAPTFGTIIANRRVAASTQDFMATLLYARSEAIKRNAPVAVVSIDDADWSTGWRIPDPSGGDDLVTHDATRAKLRIAETSGITTITFNGNGRLAAGGVAPVISLCDSGNKATKRAVNLDLAGMPSASREGSCP